MSQIDNELENDFLESFLDDTNDIMFESGNGSVNTSPLDDSNDELSALLDLDDEEVVDDVDNVEDIDSEEYSDNFDDEEYIDTDDYFDTREEDSESEQQEKVIRTKKFSKKFYISYFGINPIVILKEEPTVIRTIIQQRPNTSYLKCLESNINGNRSKREHLQRIGKPVAVVEGFIDNIDDYMSNFTDVGTCKLVDFKNELLRKYNIDTSTDTDSDNFIYDYFCQCVKISNEFKKKWEEIHKEINLKVPSTRSVLTTNYISNQLKSYKGNNDVLSLFNTGYNGIHPMESTNKVFLDILYNMESYGDMIGYLCSLIIDVRQSRLEEADASEYQGDIISEYLDRTYDYGVMGRYNIPELLILADMGFPTSIAYNENLIKRTSELVNDKPSRKSKSKSKRGSEVNITTAVDNKKFLSFVFSNKSMREAGSNDKHFWSACKPKF